jgi:hypothetical protein
LTTQKIKYETIKEKKTKLYESIEKNPLKYAIHDLHVAIVWFGILSMPLFTLTCLKIIEGELLMINEFPFLSVVICVNLILLLPLPFFYVFIGRISGKFEKIKSDLINLFPSAVYQDFINIENESFKWHRCGQMHYIRCGPMLKAERKIKK